jgi:DNA-binding winged helix-turn-helix (wHTH) protein/TolB-like protein/Flp pilus assembly protein TadD
VIPERPARGVIRFGVFEVDLRAGELFKQGHKIRIQQQPFRILALLLEHPGQVVTREELRQAIWPAGTFVEFDVGLDAAIHKLRSALGDSAENPRVIETLPRRGYRLIVPVDRVAPPEAPRRAAAIIVGALALAAAVFLWHPWSRHPTNSVAVLFTARDSADAYLADGLTEDVTSLLGSVASVQVKAPGVVRRAQRGSPGDAPAIARALGVHYLLDGNVRRVGARVRVSIRLLTGATAIAAWGDVFDRRPDELLVLPSEIARAVAQHVGGPAPSAEALALAAARTQSPAAYDHYLRGNFFLARRSPDQTALALAEYREAERLDSGFAAAIGRAAYAHAIARGNYYRLPDAPIESLAVRGLAIANRALRRDSTSSDAWMARGYLLAFARPRTMDGAVEAFQRSIALDPKNAEAHHQYGAILGWLGRNAEADRELHLALALDPGRAISFSDLAAWSHVRDTALAVALMDSAVALDPASAFSRRWRALARLWAGDVRGAQEDAELANRLQPGDIVMESVLATVLAHAGDSARARALMAHWPGRNEHWLIMAALVAVGDTVAALDRVERASPVPYLWAGLRRPEFDALHGNPRYERLVAALRPAGAQR